jgi:hypothetical protein
MYLYDYDSAMFPKCWSSFGLRPSVQGDCLTLVDEGIMNHRNVGNHSPNDKASRHRTPESSEPQFWHLCTSQCQWTIPKSMAAAGTNCITLQNSAMRL